MVALSKTIVALFNVGVVPFSGEGSVATVAYNFLKPEATESVPKESFVTRVGDQGCGVGYYK